MEQKVEHMCISQNSYCIFSRQKMGYWCGWCTLRLEMSTEFQLEARFCTIVMMCLDVYSWGWVLLVVLNISCLLHWCLCNCGAIFRSYHFVNVHKSTVIYILIDVGIVRVSHHLLQGFCWKNFELGCTTTCSMRLMCFICYMFNSSKVCEIISMEEAKKLF